MSAVGGTIGDGGHLHTAVTAALNASFSFAYGSSAVGAEAMSKMVTGLWSAFIRSHSRCPRKANVASSIRDCAIPNRSAAVDRSDGADRSRLPAAAGDGRRDHVTAVSNPSPGTPGSNYCGPHRCTSATQRRVLWSAPANPLMTLNDGRTCL